jgi:hypothetical protein
LATATRRGDAVMRVAPVVVDRTAVEPIFRSRAVVGKRRTPVGMNISVLLVPLPH